MSSSLQQPTTITSSTTSTTHIEPEVVSPSLQKNAIINPSTHQPYTRTEAEAAGRDTGARIGTSLKNATESAIQVGANVGHKIVDGAESLVNKISNATHSTSTAHTNTGATSINSTSTTSQPITQEQTHLHV